MSENELFQKIWERRHERHVFHVVLGQVSRDRLTRYFRLYIMCEGELIALDGLLASMCGYKRNSYGVAVRGVGMDMAFYMLERFLSAVGSRLGAQLPANTLPAVSYYKML